MNTAGSLPRGLAALLRQQSSSQPSLRPLSRSLTSASTARVSSSRWACSSCRRQHQRAVAPSSAPYTTRRPMSNSAPRRAQEVEEGQKPEGYAAQAPLMEKVREEHRKKNLTGMNYAISIMLGTLALAYGSVPLYKMICQTTGWGGQPVKAPGHGSTSGGMDPATRMTPVTSAKRIRVTFNASVSDVLPWKFTPQQREVRVLPGETALAFYTATNMSDRDIIGVATYSVTPAQTAGYFSKIQCFCFEEQRLNAGETVDMPVFFYLDPDLLNDLNMRGVDHVTLSYTFFKARYDDNGSFRDIAPVVTPAAATVAEVS